MSDASKVISYKRIQGIINDIPELRTRAMVAAQYGLAARAGELIRYTHSDDRVTPGLLLSNIEQRKDGRLYCTIPNFKNARLNFKTPCIVQSEGFLFEPVVKWLGYCGEQVFPLRISRYRQLVAGALPDGLASHALRHSRATHLAEIFGFSAYKIKAFLGHARLDTSALYVEQDLGRAGDKIEEYFEEVD